jgi:hypothetical protein
MADFKVGDVVRVARGHEKFNCDGRIGEFIGGIFLIHGEFMWHTVFYLSNFEGIPVYPNWYDMTEHPQYKFGWCKFHKESLELATDSELISRAREFPSEAESIAHFLANKICEGE